MSDYKGWKIPDKVVIVAKDMREWKDGDYVTTGRYQGYVVDANNKEMLESAHSWAKWTEYVKPYDQETHTYADVIEHPGIEYQFENEGFTLKLLNSADGSSQGGKLSFWNCEISKDDRSFVIGIASDYLLEILLYNTFIDGVCQEKLSFARCKGGVGMTTKNMPIYKQFLEDEQKRAAVGKGKTKKRVPGHCYSTLTCGHVFFGTYYRWYEPVYEQRGYYYGRQLIGFKKLAEPIVQYWQPEYNPKFTKKSDYLNSPGYRRIYWDNTTPARTDIGQVADIDMSCEEILEEHLKRVFSEDNLPENKFFNLHSYWEDVGVTTSKTEYELPDNIRKFILQHGFKIFD